MFAREIAPAGHVVVAGHDRARRRPAVGVAAGQAVLVPARQGARCRCRSRSAIDASRSRCRSPAAPCRDRAAPSSRRRPRDRTTPASTVESLPLIRLAWARSGDKGDLSNIGVGRAPRRMAAAAVGSAHARRACKRLARPPGARRGRALPPARHRGDELRAARCARRRRPVVARASIRSARAWRRCCSTCRSRCRRLLQCNALPRHPRVYTLDSPWSQSYSPPTLGS